MNEVQTMTTEQKALIEYKITPAEIQKQVDGYLTLKVLPDDPKSYQQAHAARMVCVKTRTGIDKRRKELGEDARSWVNAVNKAAKDLTLLIEPAESYLTDELGVEDGRRAEVKAEKAKKEAERIAGIKYRIDTMKAATLGIQAHPSTLLREMMTRILDTELAADVFQEFLTEAEQAREKVVSDLMIAIDARKKWEKEEAKRKAENEWLEKIRQEQAAEAARQAEERRKIDAEKAAIEAQKKAEADRIAREAWEKKTAEEAKAKAEKDAAERIEREAKAKEEREAKEAEEKVRLEALRPDKERLLVWSAYLDTIEGPQVKDEKAVQIVLDAKRLIAKAAASVRKAVKEL